MKKIAIVEFPSNLGLKEIESGHEPGVKFLPDFFEKHGFHSKINPDKIVKLVPLIYSMDLDEESKVRNADKIIEFAQNQSEIIEENIKENIFSIVLGGDCSILIGNALALKKSGNYGLFFLDGHTDFMWPEISQTGGLAGMDLAVATGFGHNKLTNIQNQKPYFKEENVFCVGNRDYEDWYVDAILNSEINYYSLEKLRKIGVEKCVSGFLEMIKYKNLDGFWIHIDVDVLDDEIMPIVDSRQNDGLNYNEFNALIFNLLKSEKAVGLEITILDPELDEKGIYTKEFVKNFCETFNKSIN